MRQSFSQEVEDGRVMYGEFATIPDERMGAFFVRCPATNERLKIIVSDGSDWEEQKLPGQPWEHVSVSCQVRCPTWQEMDFVKDCFFGHDETVVQFHVAKSSHVNIHGNCLHLWKLANEPFPLPPKECV